MESFIPNQLPEHHRTHRIGWLRATVLGANDGILSTGSLIVGVAAAHGAPHDIVVAGVAGLVAGAMSMAAGEYVSVSSQADTERADLLLERKELTVHTEAEKLELAGIYTQRGLEPTLAKQVAEQLMKHDALGAHARDELGISEVTSARPVQAAMVSALSFSLGAGLPLLAVWLLPPALLICGVVASSMVFLVVLGALAAYAGGASLWRGAARVTIWGALAMGFTAGVGALFGR